MSSIDRKKGFRDKYIYFDNTRTQRNILWGEIYAMDCAPPGTHYYNGDDPGRHEDTDEGRCDLHVIKEPYRNDRDNLSLWWKKDDTGFKDGRDNHVYTEDSARWDDGEEYLCIEGEDDAYELMPE